MLGNFPCFLSSADCCVGFFFSLKTYSFSHQIHVDYSLDSDQTQHFFQNYPACKFKVNVYFTKNKNVKIVMRDLPESTTN